MLICHIDNALSTCHFSIRKGGPNPSSNMVLAAILEKARALDVPKEFVERNMKKASEKGQDTFTEKVYEV
jgi:transcriptional/translational regulatory protein YebC/TACO1